MKKYIAAGLAAFAFAIAGAQPAPPLVIVVGGPPGNPGDLVIRAMSAQLGVELGQPVVVENKPGAAGTVALSTVARAKPDGNVLGVLALQSAAAPALIASLPYDTTRDLVPVRQLSWVSNVLVVRPDSPFLTLDDLLQSARKAPVTYASGGNGTPAHLAGELFAQEGRAQLQHVPFNGAVGGINAVLGGHVQMMFATSAAAAPLVESGRLRALASAAPERLAYAASTPTLAEAGMPVATLRDWHGLVAPPGTPPERVERIAAAVGKVLALDAVRQRLAAAGMEPAASSPQEFKAWVESEVARWGVVVRKARITLQ